MRRRGRSKRPGAPERIPPEKLAEIEARLARGRGLTIAQGRALLQELHAAEWEMRELRTNPPDELVDRWLDNQVAALERAIAAEEEAAIQRAPGSAPPPPPAPGSASGA